jgi:hypothetical protein
MNLVFWFSKSSIIMWIGDIEMTERRLEISLWRCLGFLGCSKNIFTKKFSVNFNNIKNIFTFILNGLQTQNTLRINAQNPLMSPSFGANFYNIKFLEKLRY